MCIEVCCGLQSETCTKLTILTNGFQSVLGNAKLEDSWNFTIMLSFWNVLWKKKWDFQGPSLIFNTTDVCFVNWAVECKERYGVGVPKLQYK